MNRSWKKRSFRGKWVALLALVISLAVMAAMAGAGSLVPSTPTTTRAVTLASGDSAQLGYVFGNFRQPKFCGYKYEDLNGNGNHDPNERGLPGILVTLNGIDGMGRSVTLSTVTGPDGSFAFNNLWPGIYTATEHPGAPIPPGTTPWSPCAPPETPPAPPVTPPVTPCNATCTPATPETPLQVG